MGDEKDNTSSEVHAKGSGVENGKVATKHGKEATQANGDNKDYYWESGDDIPDTHRCGYFGCKPDWLQPSCNTPGMLLTAECLFFFAQTFITSGMVAVNMSTLETRYQLSSSQVAWIPVTYDLAAGVVAITSGYLGVFAHNGLLLGWSCFIMGLGSFTMTMPHWLGGNYDAGVEETQLCDVWGNGTICEESTSSYLGFFILAQIFHAVGGGTLWVIAFPYLDSNVKTKYMPWYIAIAFLISGAGAAVGYIVGGLLLSIYVDVGRVDMDDVTLEPSDPQWVGAWWIGYLIAGSISVLVAVFMWAFPKELPSGLALKAMRKSEAYKGKGDHLNKVDNFGKSCKDFGDSCELLWTNPIWILNTIITTVVSGLVVALGAFLPKLMETQFSMSAGAAAAAAGAAIIPGTIIGLLIGGWIPRGLDLKARGLMGVCLAASLMGMGMSFIYLVHCATPNIAGVTVPYFASDSSQEIEGDANVYHPCNFHCNCTTAAYTPICGNYDDVIYFSPCMAGCMESREDSNEDVHYYDCSCVNTTYADPGTENADASHGMCEVDCSDDLTLFLILFILQIIFTFFGMPAGQALGLRIITDKERAFAFGVSSIIVRYCGNVPAPLIFGAIFDSSCLLWQESCDEVGQCWIYDSSTLAWGFVWCVFVVCAVTAICYVTELIVYRPPPESEMLVVEVKPNEALSEEEQKALEARAVQSASRGSVVSVESSTIDKNPKAVEAGTAKGLEAWSPQPIEAGSKVSGDDEDDDLTKL